MNKSEELVALAADVSAASVLAESTFESIPGWDSLALMRLVTLLEEQAGAELSVDQILSLKAVPDVERVVQTLVGKKG